MIRLQEKHNKTISLRKNGYSLSEISKRLNISQSTASLWCRGIVLSKSANERIARKSIRGTSKGLQTIKRNRETIRNELISKAKNIYFQIKFDDNVNRLLCSIMYICEGTTDVKSGPTFTNSDPYLVKLYLHLLRCSFNLDEKKFRVCVHLHRYHNTEEQLMFWSKICGIPLSQFMKPYKKENTGKRRRENYQGCVSIRYYNSKIARELRNLYEIYLNNMRV